METEKRINVLHLLLSLETGGMERFVYEHCLGIDKNLFNVSVCCIDRLGGFYASLIENGIRVNLIQKNQDHFDWFFSFKLGAYLRHKRIDVLHIHTGAFFHGSLAGFWARTPAVLYTEHGRHFVEPRALYYLDKISAFFSDRIVTVSSALERHLIEQIRLPEKKIETVINGVNTEVFSLREKPQYLLDELSVDSTCRIIGAVGRLAEIKDHFTLIKAFRLVKDRIPNCKLVLVGEGPCAVKLKLLAEELKLLDDVIFTGNRSDIPELLNLFDLFVLPSLMEGTSISLLEAMASGTPPIVTDVGGNTSVVTDNVNGCVTFPRDYTHMAGKIIYLLEHEVEYEYFKQQSRKCVETNFSLKNNLQEYMSIYSDILKLNGICL